MEMKGLGIIVAGLVGVQSLSGALGMLFSLLMSRAFDPVTIAAFLSFFSFLFLSPLSLLLERKLWPNTLSLKLVAKLLSLALSGVTLFQILYLEGMKRTSASLAAAMTNLSPAFIFFIAWSLGMEKVKLSCVYSRVKIGGTVLCVVGASMMCLMQSTTASPSPSITSFLVLDMDKALGCLSLLVAVLIFSANLVLQASILREFPAPMSMFCVVSFIGAFTTAAAQIVRYGYLSIGGSASTRPGLLIGCTVLGGLVSGASLGFNGWVIKKKGPVFVSMFGPIATVVCVVVSSLALGDPFSLGSFVGVVLMLGGMYSVLWAKGKESFEKDVMESEFDPQKSLLLP